MIRRLKLIPEAREELHEAAAWYESRRRGLGHEFRNEVNDALGRIAEGPGRFVLVPNVPFVIAARQCHLPRFPYSVVFVDLGDRIRVLAIAHQKREPGYWHGRH
jgi:hypothetical protein